MKHWLAAALATASALTLGSAAQARSAASGPAAESGQEATLGEIVVTARRRSESLQEVPQTVNAVTADTLQKLNIRQFQDLQNVVPGLNLQSSTTGYQGTASLRGVVFAQNTGVLTGTVGTYLNDAPVVLSFLFQSLFDVGQVEILKGPQGTTRGVSAPSGAITVTTRKPSLSDFGGYVDVTATDQQGRNAQGAINVPIIKDVLAVRVAGVIDTNRGDGVRSIHSLIEPRNRTGALRVSVGFEPTDAFNANLTYQHLDQDITNFIQVTGPGPGAFNLGGTAFPAGFEPPLSAKSRAAVQDTPNTSRNHLDIITAQLDSRLFGQHLSYVGSYQLQKTSQRGEGDITSSSGDVGDVLPGVAVFTTGTTRAVQTTHELRLASDPAPGRFIDYTVGAFYSWHDVTGHIGQPGPLLPGAFGPPSGVDLGLFNPAYQIPVSIDIPRGTQETSLFGSVTLHLGRNTELSGGVRHIWAIDNNHTVISIGNGLVAVPAAAFGGNCAALHFASTYPGFCDLPLNTAAVTGNFANYSSDSPNIYNVSLSHHVTRDFLLYANTGTAFRGPVASVGIQGQLANFTLPDGGSLSFHPAETSRSYEVGFKSTWLDDRLRINAALYRQRFHNFTQYVPNIAYNNVAPGQNPATTFVPVAFAFTASVDTLVQGFDVDTAFQVTPNWNVSAQISYADGKVEGSQVPCNITDAAGRPVFNTGNLISLCPGGAASNQPLWNATFQSEYVRPVSGSADGFFRLLANYYPENKRAEPNFVVPAYSLVNLYLGLRSHDGAWEASIFARNTFNALRALDVSPVATNLNTSLSTAFPQLIHPTGYFQTITTPVREVGVNLHFAWGSR